MRTHTRRTKVAGRAFETELTENLLTHSFWAMMLTSTFGGQPFDIIAQKNNVGYAIECKELMSGERFNPRRIEDNQRFAMSLWKESGGAESWFMFRLKDGSVYAVHSDEVLAWTTPEEVRRHGIPFAEWLELRK